MTWSRAGFILAVVGLGAALLFALASRTPAHIRGDEPGPGARDPELGASFTDEQIARHGAYRRGVYAGVALGLIVQVVCLVVLARGPIAVLATALERRGVHWLLRHALIALVVLGIILLITMPLGYVGFVNEHAWGRSTQDVTGWIGDRMRAFAVGGVVAMLAALLFFASVRWAPRWWWVWGWVAFSVLSVFLAFLWPILVAPLFNRFEPLPPGSLRARVTELADRAGVEVGEVLVVDASRRSTVENAYVAGLGTSKRLVLFDTLVDDGNEDESAFVVAHELGHQVENHVLKNVVLRIGGLLVGFLVLAWLAHRAGVWSWAGAYGIGDVRALPLLLLFAIGANLISLPVDNAISRRFEARADQVAFELTQDRATAVGLFRRLAFSNLADLRPPAPAVWALFTHPPIAQRIGAAQAGPSP
jgi:STE24 endopeptidase